MVRATSQDRAETVEIFRARLAEVIRASGLSRSAFARAVGTDRSTLSQLLAPEGRRLPRAETIAAIAALAQVSVDWLLGLSQEGQLGTRVVEEAIAIERGAGSPTDERLERWHAAAAGYKIRYVPSTLPDLLKTEDVIRYEFGANENLGPEDHIEAAESRLAYSRRPETDVEVCSPYQTVESFARGEGLWRELAPAVRRAQLVAMADILGELYPTLRWFLFDGRRRYSVPVTIFGPQRAAIYVGDMYLVFNSTEHIRALTAHFDGLIRAAVMHPPEVTAWVRSLADGIEA